MLTYREREIVYNFVFDELIQAKLVDNLLVQRSNWLLLSCEATLVGLYFAHNRVKMQEVS